jgi:hypothetical protein
MTMRLLTQDALVVCAHELGKVSLPTSQTMVRVGGRLVLVEPNPEGRSIAGCPNIGVSIRPCLNTLRVAKGYSGFVRIDGQPVVLDNLGGLTDGTPAGGVRYVCRAPGQRMVGASA